MAVYLLERHARFFREPSISQFIGGVQFHKNSKVQLKFDIGCKRSFLNDPLIRVLKHNEIEYSGVHEFQISQDQPMS